MEARLPEPPEEPTLVAHRPVSLLRCIRQDGSMDGRKLQERWKARRTQHSASAALFAAYDVAPPPSQKRSGGALLADQLSTTHLRAMLLFIITQRLFGTRRTCLDLQPTMGSPFSGNDFAFRMTSNVGGWWLSHHFTNNFKMHIPLSFSST